MYSRLLKPLSSLPAILLRQGRTPSHLSQQLTSWEPSMQIYEPVRGHSHPNHHRRRKGLLTEVCCLLPLEVKNWLGWAQAKFTSWSSTPSLPLPHANPVNSITSLTRHIYSVPSCYPPAGLIYPVLLHRRYTYKPQNLLLPLFSLCSALGYSGFQRKEVVRRSG